MTGGAEVAFTTSGTSGPPVSWLRTTAQLDAEVRLLLAMLGRVDRVLSFAPPHHLYGHLFGVGIPRVADVPVVSCWSDPMRLPGLRSGARHLLVCLPSTWPVLLRHAAVLRGHDIVAVHSTASTTDAVYEVADRLRDAAFQGVEVLGSTETGGVAVRAVDPDRRSAVDWSLLPDVTWLRDRTGEQRLHVRSPRIARRPDMAGPPASYRMPDLVVPTGERTFRRVGRASGLVKINGRRCDLDGVAALVRRLVPGAEVLCVPVPDPLRGEHYDLYYTTGPEPSELRARLAKVRGDVPAPRSVVRVAAIGAR